MSLYELLVHLLFWLGLVIGLTGLCMVLAPVISLKFSARLNTWVDTDRWFRKLDVPHSSERMFYRFHRTVGILIILGALFIFYTFVIKHDVADLQTGSLVLISASATDWLLSSAVFFISLASLVFLFFGIVIVVRPSSLKGIENRLNQWVDTSEPEIKQQHREADVYFSRHPRLVGLAVLLGGIYLLLSAGILLLN